MLSLASLLDTQFWLLEVIANFREIFFVACLSLLIFALFAPNKCREIFWSMIFGSVVNGIFVFPLYGGLANTSDRGESHEYHLIFANINSRNTEKNRFLDYVKEARPDFLILVETSNEWKKSIKSLEPFLPHAKIVFLDGNFGIGALSRLEIENDRLFLDRENSIPALTVTIELEEQVVVISALHPFPPLGEHAVMLKKQYLKTLSTELRDVTGPVVACGDFNSSPWLSVMKNFIDTSGLHFPKGFMPIRSWPAIPFVPKLRLDNCLVRGVRVGSYERGPYIGSDHYPISLKFSVVKE